MKAAMSSACSFERVVRGARVLATFVGAALLSSGCVSVHHAVLSGPAPLNNAPLELSVESHREGAVSARLADGEECTGRFNTIASEVDTWDEEQQTSTSPEVSQVGMLVLVCPAGLVVRCDFSRSWEGEGSGSCWDEQHRRYGLVL
jgi:hypothetical protein